MVGIPVGLGAGRVAVGRTGRGHGRAVADAAALLGLGAALLDLVERTEGILAVYILRARAASERRMLSICQSAGPSYLGMGVGMAGPSS